MSSSRKRALIAVVVGLVVAAAVVAVAATQLTTKRAVVSINAPIPASGPSNGFQGTPGGGGLGGPGLGGGFRRGGFGVRSSIGFLGTAATYLGVSQSTLQTELAGGKTLAQVATSRGKTAAGLVSAMVAATRKELDAAVASGRFTKAQEATIVASLEQRYQALVNGSLPGPGDFGRGFGGDDGGGFGGGGPGQGGAAGSFGGGAVPA